MDALVKKVNEILNTFIQEEIGNRLSQFAMKGLRDLLITEIIKYKPIKNEVKKEDVKK